MLGVRAKFATDFSTKIELTVSEFWRGYLKKGAFTLVPSENRTRAPCSGAKCEHSLRLLNTHICVVGTLRV